MRCPLFVVLILTIATLSFGLTPEVLYEWKYVEFEWDSKEQQEAARESGDYNASSCIFYDVDRTSDGRTFVTIVRDEGVPVSLLTVSDKMGPGGPLLIPYPNWSWYDTHECDDIISVYRVSIECNYMFVLDCGWIGNEQVCPAKLLIFDLKGDRLVKRINIPDNISQNENGTGLLVTPLAYVPDCNIEDATVFMADILGFGLVTYDNKDSSFCRIESNYMKPTNPDFIIQNQSFSLDDGILGLTMINKYLYYTPLAGDNMYKVDIWNDKQNCSNLNESKDELTQLAGTLSGQTAAIASEQCSVFFSNIPETSILCQDATKEFNSTNTELIAQDSETLQFISGMKVTHYGKELIFLSNRFQRYYTDTLDLNEINFRVLTLNIPQIWETTNCSASCKNNHKPGHHGHHGHGGRWPGHGGRWPVHGGRWPGHGGRWPVHGGRWPGHGGRWPGHGGRWPGRFWHYGRGHFNKDDKYDKDDKHDKYDKDDKDDKHDKYDKDDKKNNKDDKDNKDDKYNKHDKYDKQKL